MVIDLKDIKWSVVDDVKCWGITHKNEGKAIKQYFYTFINEYWQ